MNTNGIARHYDKLTPEERFRLIMAAASRGDLAEGDTFADHAHYVHGFAKNSFS